MRVDIIVIHGLRVGDGGNRERRVIATARPIVCGRPDTVLRAGDKICRKLEILIHLVCRHVDRPFRQCILLAVRDGFDRRQIHVRRAA